MPPLAVDEAGFGSYRVPDYETLLDHPAEMGEFEQVAFEVQDKPHRFVVSGRQRGDLARLARDLAKICEAEAALFGALPVSDYLFLLQVVGSGYGGLEHRNSCSLMIARDNLPMESMREPTVGYRRLLGLCSHEYFHLWLVKRITPEVFRQAGTEQEVYTRQLWIFEGITSYYDELMLVRSGVVGSKDYLEMLAETVTRVMRSAGRFRQTLEESSFDAWTKFYKQDENAPNAIISYYAKGALVALLLDLNIRLRSDGRHSLDDVMRALWRTYGEPGIGLPERAFEALVEDETGLAFTAEFDHWLRSTEELPLAEILRAFGVELHLLPAKSPTDMGGVLQQRPDAQRVRLELGVRWEQRPGGILLQQVFDGGAAQLAGLAAGDEIVAVDGLRLEAGALQGYLERLPPNTPVPVHAFRRDELLRFELAPLPAPADTCHFYVLPEMDAPTSRRQADWLQADASRD
jgi:predicted metalloprotease with PDZ domain